MKLPLLRNNHNWFLPNQWRLRTVTEQAASRRRGILTTPPLQCTTRDIQQESSAPTDELSTSSTILQKTKFVHNFLDRPKALKLVPGFRKFRSFSIFFPDVITKLVQVCPETHKLNDSSRFFSTSSNCFFKHPNNLEKKPTIHKPHVAKGRKPNNRHMLWSLNQSWINPRLIPFSWEDILKFCGPVILAWMCCNQRLRRHKREDMFQQADPLTN